MENKAIYISKESDRIVDDFKTKHEQGFTSEEIRELIKFYEFDSEKFYEDLGVNTGLLIAGDFITFCTDIEKAVRLALGGTIHIYEWD